MPSKSTRKRSTVTDDVAAMAQAPAPVDDTAPVSSPVAGPPALPDTAATRGVWAALIAQPGSTAASLADAAGISRPTAAKALAVLEKAGLVRAGATDRSGCPISGSRSSAPKTLAPQTGSPQTSRSPNQPSWRCRW